MPEAWKRNLIKSSRNKEKSSIHWKGKQFSAWMLRKPCKCRMNCSEKICEETRKVLFQEYWDLEDINRQLDVLSRNLTIQDKERTRIRKQKNESENQTYVEFEAGNENSRKKLHLSIILTSTVKKYNFAK